MIGCAGDGGSDRDDEILSGILSPEEARTMTSERWVTSKNERITIVEADGSETTLTQGYPDMKASWSLDEPMIVFMRVVYRSAEVIDWKTRICVINVDGTGLRELTSGQHADYNPTWARDGSNAILFFRCTPFQCSVYRTYYDNDPGEEEMLSNPSYSETAPSTLSDGRIFVDRRVANMQYSYLMTPVENGDPIYEEITRPSNDAWHKLSVSPSETKVVYMQAHGPTNNYRNATLCIADFDVENLTISNPIEFTNYTLFSIDEYPRWSSDESVVIFDSTRSGEYQAYLYRLDDAVFARISPDQNSGYGYSCCFENVPK